MCCADHNQLLADSDHAVKATQQLTLLSERHGEQLHKMQNDIVYLSSSTPFKDDTTSNMCTEGKLNETTNNLHTPANNVNGPKDEVPHEDDNVAGTDDTSCDGKDYLRYHPYSQKLFHQSGSQKHVPNFHVSTSCKNVVIGDSNLQSIIKKKLDPTRNTEIRTYRGANMRRIATILDSCQNSFSKC